MAYYETENQNENKNENENEDENDAQLQRVLWESQLITRQQRQPQRRGALQIIEYMLKTEPDIFQAATINHRRPTYYTNQMISNQNLRRKRDDEFVIYPNPQPRAYNSEFAISYKPTAHDPLIEKQCGISQSTFLALTKDSILGQNKLSNQTMTVIWCDRYVPGAGWLRNGDSTFDQNEETELFTCSSVFSHCLPNELAFQLPLSLTSALWMSNVKLLRTKDSDILPNPEEKYITPRIGTCFLPWIINDSGNSGNFGNAQLSAGSSNNNNNNNEFTQPLTEQIVLLLNIAYIQNVTDIIIPLDRWSKHGAAPVEIAQRFVQGLNRFVSQNPKNILYLRDQLRITFSIRPEVFTVWSMSFQSAFNSDTRHKEDTRIQEQKQQQPHNNQTRTEDAKSREAARRLLYFVQQQKLRTREQERQLYLRSHNNNNNNYAKTLQQQKKTHTQQDDVPSNKKKNETKEMKETKDTTTTTRHETKDKTKDKMKDKTGKPVGKLISSNYLRSTFSSKQKQQTAKQRRA